MKSLLKCTKCENYTINQICSCGGKAVTVKPPKFSPEDKYGNYRREAKEKQLKEKGLI